MLFKLLTIGPSSPVFVFALSLKLPSRLKSNESKLSSLSPLSSPTKKPQLESLPSFSKISHMSSNSKSSFGKNGKKPPEVVLGFVVVIFGADVDGLTGDVTVCVVGATVDGRAEVSGPFVV